MEFTIVSRYRGNRNPQRRHAMEERPMAAWMQVLGQIDEALAKTLDQWPEPETQEAGGSTARHTLRYPDERFARLQACLDQAGREAAEVEALLTAQLQAVENWFRSTAEIRQRLEKRAIDSV
jgi:hypothetical protein